MFWLPVIFMCLANAPVDGSAPCKFVHFDTMASEKLCVQTVQALSKRMDTMPEIKAYQTSCLPIKPSKDKLVLWYGKPSPPALFL